jgi:hypothetical protein
LGIIAEAITGSKTGIPRSDAAAAVEIGGRSSRIGKADQALGNPRRDAGMTRYAKRHDRQQRSEHPVEQNPRKQAAST